MSTRGRVTDYAGNELFPGDLINYPSRVGNRVRATDAIVEVATVEPTVVGKVGVVLIPVLKVRPTGIESGFAKRRTDTSQWITTEHVRLVERGEE